ncbi:MULTISPECIES: hypothetical protein [Agrobacterium]|uniref:hypothetical protein n=1 Tax=Agrobacterium TaxID=357 RepID=UPI001586C4D3|nr:MULTISPECIES: hypothetical protein [Agrobacterium]
MVAIFISFDDKMASLAKFVKIDRKRNWRRRQWRSPACASPAASGIGRNVFVSFPNRIFTTTALI